MFKYKKIKYVYKLHILLFLAQLSATIFNYGLKKRKVYNIITSIVKIKWSQKKN